MTTTIDVATALRAARAAGLSSLDAQLLLARVLGTTRTGLVAHDDRVLADEEETRWRDGVSRRLDGEPLAYVLGEKEFAGLLFEVGAGVLVPRPETETLVDWAVELLAARPSAERTLADLGTGSGAIAVAVRHRCPQATVTATDVSDAALAVAARNVARHGGGVELLAGSWWAPLGGRVVDVVVSNPPYVAAGDPHLAALRHEPPGALVSGGDGLDALREIVTGAGAHLKPGGWLLLEHGFDQAEPVRSLLVGAGLADVVTRRDLAGQSRVSGGQWRPDRGR